MDNVKVRKLALCEAYKVVLQPGEPYVFEAVPGCGRCRELLAEANKTYDKDFSFEDPKVADMPIYATRTTIPLLRKKVSKSSKKKG